MVCMIVEEAPVSLIVDHSAAMLNYSLSRTERINTHGLHLATTVDPYTLTDQVFLYTAVLSSIAAIILLREPWICAVVYL